MGDMLWWQEPGAGTVFGMGEGKQKGEKQKNFCPRKCLWGFLVIASGTAHLEVSASSREHAGSVANTGPAAVQKLL